MKKSLTSDEIVIRMMNVILNNLDELKGVQNIPEEAFQYGEKTAYIECFELMQEWEKAGNFGVGFDVEFYFNFK